MPGDSLAVSLFNQLLGQYNGSIIGIEQGSIKIGQELFFPIAAVSIAVLGINRLLSKNVDAVETNIELIRLIIYVNVFYLFITQFPQLLQVIVNSFKHAAFYMGGMIGQNTGASANSSFIVATNPGAILNQGVGIASTILSLSVKKFTLANFGISLLAIPCAGVVLFCFGSIAIKVVIIEISSKLILSAGIFLLAFSGSPWTRDYATRYVGTFFSIGIQMLFIYLMVGIGGGLTNTWINILSNIPPGQLIETYVAVIMATFVYYKLSLSLPEQAAGYLGGGLIINAGKGPSLGAATAIAGVGIAMGAKAVMGMGANAFGTIKAWNTAGQVSKASGDKTWAEGKIKTLGSASIEMAKDGWKATKEKWTNQVNETAPGKLAQKVASIHASKTTVQPSSQEFKEGGGI